MMTRMKMMKPEILQKVRKTKGIDKYEQRENKRYSARSRMVQERFQQKEKECARKFGYAIGQW